MFLLAFFKNYESSISSMDNVVTMKNDSKSRKSDDCGLPVWWWMSSAVSAAESCAVLDITHTTTGICCFLVSKVKENMWPFRSFLLQRKKRRGLILRGTCFLCQVSMTWRKRTSYKLSPYLHECALPSQINKGSKKKKLKEEKKSMTSAQSS